MKREENYGFWLVGHEACKGRYLTGKVFPHGKRHMMIWQRDELKTEEFEVRCISTY